MENTKKIKLIVTGTTGMVGEGVVHECLQHPQVASVLIINRKPSGITHPKLKEVIHKDFFDITPLQDQIKNYDGCLFCLGVSSIGMKEEQYTKMTYTLTLNFAKVLSSVNPGMTLCYISGASTDSTEKGSSMWAKVKGKTENDLMKLPFRKVYAFRPGYLHPTPGLKNTLKYYKYVTWLYPVVRNLFPGFVLTLKELGLAMVNVVREDYPKNVLEVKDIGILAKK